MKHFSLFLALLATTHAALAQPDAKPQVAKAQTADTDEDKDDERLTNKDNLSGMALIGSFYNALQHAQTFKGRMRISKTVTKNGQTTESQTDWSSASASDFKGQIQKLWAQVSYTQTTNGKTTTGAATWGSDGQTTRTFLPALGVWSQEPQDKTDFDLPRETMSLLWSTTLAAFEQGATFKVEERESKTGAAQLAVIAHSKDDEGEGMLEAVFDKNTGLLQSWTLQGDGNGDKTQMSFVDIELNKAIAPETFVLSVPANAKQVAPKKTDLDLNLKF